MRSEHAVYSLREANLADLNQLDAIEKACFDSDRLSRRRLRFYIDAPHAELLVAGRTDETGNIVHLVGYALLLLRRGTQLTRLYSIAVLPEARGNKIAESLITALEERALERGKRFMRLEVSTDNHGAVALYTRLGFRRFGMYTDYYDDHSDALRMQKVLVAGHSHVRQVPYPWYQQTTEFTCGPASLMMALRALGHEIPLTQHTELSLWRRATTIFMTSGHGGCHPIGLALAAYDHGVNATVWVNQGLPLFVDGVRSAHKKEIIEAVELDFATEAATRGIEVSQADWRLDDVTDALRAGKTILCLISTYAFDKRKAPHWVTVTSFDEHNVYLHDPDAEDGQPVEYQHIPVAKEDFLRLASYGQRKVRALVILNV
ncbi:GNAT family N-acetyltransferase/peptidase C39 family protein [Alteromonas sp. CYL-A6]|uniref:GNAT family N-acetyltransferase/peptidase C39 family protein n=1 Tax=Alteromonas nitratireducens TaxID=3390813 RepID=UPI0034AFF9A1